MTDAKLEGWMEYEKYPASMRERIRQFAKHSVSCYKVTGGQIWHPFDREDLFEVLLSMERFLIDSNSPASIRDATRATNRDKAFIIGYTFIDEQDNLENTLLGHDNCNNNLFGFGYIEEDCDWPLGECVMIHRLDEHQRFALNMWSLRLESRPRQKRLKDDPEFIEREKDRTAKNRQFKVHITHKILSVTDLVEPEDNDRKKLELIEIIRSKSAQCFKNYHEAAEIASLCYSALLLEPDEVGKKTRKEFHDKDGNPKRNCFGDTHLIQNALWLNSRIISKDAAVVRMAEYLNLRDVTVKQVV